MSETEVTPRRGRRLRGGSCGRGRMPVAVMAEGGFGFRKLLEQCETQELEVRGAAAGLGFELAACGGGKRLGTGGEKRGRSGCVRVLCD